MAERAGIPLSAVKYHQREGLLPPGVRSAPNQVSYDDAHVQRVRLVRALLETGHLSIAATRAVITVLDTDSAPLAETFRVAQHAMSGSRAPALLRAASRRLPRLRPPTTRRHLVLTAALGYAAVTVLLTVQAGRGRSVVHPAGAVLLAGCGLALLAVVAVGVLLARPVPTPALGR